MKRFFFLNKNTSKVYMIKALSQMLFLIAYQFFTQELR